MEESESSQQSHGRGDLCNNIMLYVLTGTPVCVAKITPLELRPDKHRCQSHVTMLCEAHGEEQAPSHAEGPITNKNISFLFLSIEILKYAEEYVHASSKLDVLFTGSNYVIQFVCF